VAETQPGKRFQFYLGDLLLLVVVHGVLCSVLLPFAYSNKHITWASTERILFVGSLGFFGCIVFVCWTAHRQSWGRLVRNWVAGIAALIGGILSPAVIIIIAMANAPISRCESAHVAACKAYCTAQDIYHRTDYDKDGVLEYSMTINGQFALCDPEIMMLDRTFGTATYGEGQPVITPKFGYLLKVLTEQGPHAKGGKLNYITYDKDNRPHLTEGYALVVAPADYKTVGEKTYIVNRDNVIYERDLGPKTLDIFKSMTEFDPDSTWEIAE